MVKGISSSSSIISVHIQLVHSPQIHGRDSFLTCRIFVDVSIHSCFSFAGSYSLSMFCLRDLRCWFKPLFDRKVFSQCRQICSSPFLLIRTDAMNSGVSLDIVTFKQLLSIVFDK